MFQKAILSAALLVTSFSLFAQETPAKSAVDAQRQQRRGPRPYTLTFVNHSDFLLDTVAKAEFKTVFDKVYPAFAQADGYRTKREVSMEISDKFEGTLSAKAGEIVVNSKWLKDHRSSFEKALMYQFSRNWVSADTIKKNGYQLVFISKAPEFDLTTKQNLINTYFKVYPKLVKKFNKKTTKEVLFVVDTAYKGVAEASGNRILFSATYMKAHPTDIDIVTHEGMHLVQGYGYSAGPVWLTEGIADYIRYKYGVDNIGSKWALPEFNDKQSYQNSYRITARFFEWLEQHVKKGLIMKLDKELRDHTYTEKSWANLTGKTIDELWSDYSKAPAVKLKYSGKAI
ncbi:basic secretory protein-like protein [Pedobacter sp. PWIIR3]